MIIGTNGRMKKWTELAPSSSDQAELPIQLVSAPKVRAAGTLGSGEMINNKEKTIWGLELLFSRSVVSDSL